MDVQDIKGSSVSTPPLPGCVVPEDGVDDIYICVKYDCDRSDGPGGALGAAMVKYVRSQDGSVDGGLPVTGYIRIDPSDVRREKQNGVIETVILHEMGHMLGIGNSWQTHEVVKSMDDECEYVGENANREFMAISGCDIIPLENDYGTGSACKHWDEECMGRELMSPALSRGNSNKLSRMTIAALQDVGYVNVNYDAADDFDSSDLGVCPCDRRERAMQQSRQPRKLSAELYDYAVKYGREILAEEPVREDQIDSDDGVEYVGDRLVRVYVFDGDDIVGVTVTPYSSTRH